MPPSGTAAPTDAAASVPFAEVLSPWTSDGERRLRQGAPRHDTVLEPGALAGLTRGLLHDLAQVISPTLLDGFHRRPGRRWFSRSSSRDYDAFVAELSHGALDDVLAAYPVLPGLLRLVTDRWAAGVLRAVGRIERDRGLLRERFGFKPPVARVDHLPGSSLLLRDRDGRSVVYKDRPPGMDAALCVLLDWVNASGPGPRLFVPDVVDRGRYGWMSEVRPAPARTGPERGRYLERTGMLVCLAYALGGGDLHARNVMACGEHPVILDAEVLLRPRRTGGDGGRASPLTTGWLPTPAHIEFSGLACEHMTEEPDWLDVGTDAMRPRPLTPWRARLRLAVQEGLRTDGPEGVERICTGFSRLYRHLAAARPPIDVFAGASPRVLLRPTRSYADAIARSVQPEHLSSSRRRNRVIREATTDVPAALLDHPLVAQAVRSAERSAVRRLEVPRFSMPATGGPLSIGGRPLGSPFPEAPLDRARRFLSEMSEPALEAHRRAIVDALSAVASGAGAAPLI